MEKIKYYFQIIRPVNFFITFLSIVVAGIICSSVKYDWLNIILAALSGGFVGAAGNVINDVYDVQIDKINRTERPLPSGKITTNQALTFFYLLNFVALIIAFQINPLSFLIVSVSEISIYFYSRSLKKIPLFGNFVVSFFTGLAFVFGGAAVNNLRNSIIPAAFALVINFIREIVKDIEDIDGDVEQNVITFPAKYGIDLSVKIIVYLTSALILLTLMPIVYNIYGEEYFISILFVNSALIFFIIKTSRDSSKSNLRKMSSFLKFIMLIGLIAIYLGAKGLKLNA